jgi:hypothetical protein
MPGPLLKGAGTFDPGVVRRNLIGSETTKILNLRGATMRAEVGDRVVIKGHHVGEPDRDAEVLEVHGAEGAPPWLLRWSDDGHEGLFFPGADAVVEHFAAGEQEGSSDVS